MCVCAHAPQLVHLKYAQAIAHICMAITGNSMRTVDSSVAASHACMAITGNCMGTVDRFTYCSLSYDKFLCKPSWSMVNPTTRVDNAVLDL